MSSASRGVGVDGAVALITTEASLPARRRRVSKANRKRMRAVSATLRLTLDHYDSAVESRRPERAAAYLGDTIRDLRRELAWLESVAQATAALLLTIWV